MIHQKAESLWVGEEPIQTFQKGDYFPEFKSAMVEKKTKGQNSPGADGEHLWGNDDDEEKVPVSFPALWAA